MRKLATGRITVGFSKEDRVAIRKVQRKLKLPHEADVIRQGALEFVGKHLADSVTWSAAEAERDEAAKENGAEE